MPRLQDEPAIMNHMNGYRLRDKHFIVLWECNFKNAALTMPNFETMS